MLAKSASQILRQQRASSLTCVHQRNFSGGGPKKPNMPASETNFDVVFVGGMNTAAIMKFLQCDGVNYKMAIITDRSRFILPQSYFGVSHGHIAELKLEIDARNGALNQTDVVTLDAELLGVESGSVDQLASVRFSGMLREEADAAAAPFDEVWNFTRPLQAQGGWVLGGIQQLSRA